MLLAGFEKRIIALDARAILLHDCDLVFFHVYY